MNLLDRAEKALTRCDAIETKEQAQDLQQEAEQIQKETEQVVEEVKQVKGESKKRNDNGENLNESGITSLYEQNKKLYESMTNENRDSLKNIINDESFDIHNIREGKHLDFICGLHGWLNRHIINKCLSKDHKICVPDKDTLIGIQILTNWVNNCSSGWNIGFIQKHDFSNSDTDYSMNDSYYVQPITDVILPGIMRKRNKDELLVYKGYKCKSLVMVIPYKSNDTIYSQYKE